MTKRAQAKERIKLAQEANKAYQERRKRSLGKGGLLKQKIKKDKMAAAFVSGLSMVKAAIAADESPSSARGDAYLHFQDPEVLALVEKYRKEFSEGCKATFQWKMERLIKVVEEYIPMSGEERLKTHEVRSALTAIAEMNKMQGHYAPEEKINNNKNINVNINVIREDVQRAKELVLTYDKPY